MPSQPLPGEELVSVPCLNCETLIEVPEGKVRYGWAKDELGKPITIPKNRCRDCSRLHDNLRHERDQEFETRFKEVIKTKNRARVKKRLEQFPVVEELAKLRVGRNGEPGFDRLLDLLEGVAGGRHNYRPFTTKAITPGMRAEIQEHDPYYDGPVPRDYRKVCGQQRREMKAMRARGEIPMASMFPQINVYHRMGEHARMGLDGEQCPECCAAPKNTGLSKKYRLKHGIDMTAPAEPLVETRRAVKTWNRHPERDLDQEE